MDPAPILSLEQLAQHCHEETAKFLQHQSYEPRYCFELLRRALQHNDMEAFNAVYRIYRPLVSNWVYHHQGFPYTDEQAEFFVSTALRTFYFALQGPKFSHFPSLRHVLAYLKLCVHTSIAQYLRDQRPLTTLPLEYADQVAQTRDMNAPIEAAEVWHHICSLIPEPRDQALARYAFVLGLKPRQIIAREPTLWQTEREISVALYRIRRTLRSDAYLNQLIGER